MNFYAFTSLLEVNVHISFIPSSSNKFIKRMPDSYLLKHSLEIKKRAMPYFEE